MTGAGLDVRGATADIVFLPADSVCRSGKAAEPDSWRSDGTIRLDGFVYRTLHWRGASPETWLAWIRYRTPSYAAQPYQQLAAYHRAAGHETEARRVLIAQQDDALRRGAITGRLPRLRHRLFGMLLGYGYRTWRAVAALGLVVALSCGLGLLGGKIETEQGRYVAQTDSGGRCSTIEQIVAGLERGLPVIDVRIRDTCDLDTKSTPGQVLTAIGVGLQISAWALATLVVAGYTGLVRKPG